MGKRLYWWIRPHLPIAVLNRRFGKWAHFSPWGVTVKCLPGNDYLVLHWHDARVYCYFSPDATPANPDARFLFGKHRCHHFFKGAC